MEAREAIERFKKSNEFFHTEENDLAIKALEKQVPKKPIDKSKNPEDWHVMHCPTCDRVFWNSGQFMHYQPKHCEKCGQEILWEV